MPNNSPGVWIDCGDGGLINLSQFDRILINGQYNDGNSTHWLEAERHVRSAIGIEDENYRISVMVRFCQSEDDVYHRYDNLVKQMREAGVTVIDGNLQSEEEIKSQG